MAPLRVSRNVIHGVTAVAELKHDRLSPRRETREDVIHGVTAVAELKLRVGVDRRQ